MKSQPNVSSTQFLFFAKYKCLENQSEKWFIQLYEEWHLFSMREYDTKKEISKKFTHSGTKLLFLLWYTHSNRDKFMREPEWENISFYSYKLKANAVVQRFIRKHLSIHYICEKIKPFKIALIPASRQLGRATFMGPSSIVQEGIRNLLNVFDFFSNFLLIVLRAVDTARIVSCWGISGQQMFGGKIQCEMAWCGEGQPRVKHYEEHSKVVLGKALRSFPQGHDGGRRKLHFRATTLA